MAKMDAQVTVRMTSEYKVRLEKQAQKESPQHIQFGPQVLLSKGTQSEPRGNTPVRGSKKYLWET